MLADGKGNCNDYRNGYCSWRHSIFHPWYGYSSVHFLNVCDINLCICTQDHETAIMHRLQEVVVERTRSLLAVMEISAELDW